MCCVLLFREIQYKLSNLLFGLLLIGLIFLGLYILWRWCSDNEEKEAGKKNEKLNMQAVYAHEIEPGIVVLQSEDGEYFRILKEYDSAKRNGYGSLTGATGQEGLDQCNVPGSYLTPASTSQTVRAQVHPKMATAPPLIPLREERVNPPPAYEPRRLDLHTY